MPVKQITQKEYNQLKRERRSRGGKSGWMLLHGPDGHYYKHEAGMAGVRAFASLKEKLEAAKNNQLTLFDV
jgi:hypothetical protein